MSSSTPPIIPDLANSEQADTAISTSTPQTTASDTETAHEPSQSGNDDPPLEESASSGTAEPANDNEPASDEPVIAPSAYDNPPAPETLTGTD